MDVISTINDRLSKYWEELAEHGFTVLNSKSCTPGTNLLYAMKSITARKYRQKYGMEMPTLKLARIMFRDNKLLFKDEEDARGTLRRIEGKSGKSRAVSLKDKEFLMEEDRPLNPYSLPESDEVPYEPYLLKHKRVLVLSDIHIPYHNIQALTTALIFAEKEKPDAILLNGDTLDCHTPSKFCKDPRARRFSEELKSMKEFLAILQKRFDCQIYFKLGNHEERYSRFLYEKAGELVGVEEFELSEIIKSRAEGIEVIGDKRIIKAGSLNILHGHEIPGGIAAPVNTARGLFLRGKVSAMQGHNHQTSEHTEQDMNGKITTTWSTGCLCELHPQYMPINKWNHGFAMVDIDGDSFQVRNKRIHNGKIL